ncbi:hypothetical protein RUND412_005695 [Rhizina undulata]
MLSNSENEETRHPKKWRIVESELDTDPKGLHKMIPEEPMKPRRSHQKIQEIAKLSNQKDQQEEIADGRQAKRQKKKIKENVDRQKMLARHRLTKS